MRSLIVMAMFTASLSYAAWNGYTEDRSLELPAVGINALEIDSGAGSLEVVASPDAQDVRVLAQIRIADADAEEAHELIESDLRLTLEKSADAALLHADFDHGMWNSRWNSSIDLQVQMPRGLALMIDDGSGPIKVDAPGSRLVIDDGSGPIRVLRAGATDIDDGSGSIDVHDIVGDVTIDDGSGDVLVRNVEGSVIIDDGSGSIDVADVSEDLTIIDDGSGSLRLSDIRGQVTQPD